MFNNDTVTSVFRSGLSTQQINAMCSRITAITAFSVALLLFGVALPVTPAAAQEQIEYKICVRTQLAEDSGTSDEGLYVTLYGATQGAEPFLIATTMKTGTVTCYSKTMTDIGHINRLHLDMRMDDDICVDAISVERQKLRITQGQASQFFYNVCLGNDADGRQHTFESRNPVAAIVAGPAVGVWLPFCQQFCDEEMTIGITDSTSSTSETSSEVSSAVEVSLSAGIELKGFSAGASRTSTQGKKSGQSLSREVASSRSSKRTKKFPLSPEYMATHNIFSVWQWGAQTLLSDGRLLTVKSQKYTCMPDGNMPTYLPSSPEDIAACRSSAGVAVTEQPSVQPERSYWAEKLNISDDELFDGINDLREEGYGEDAIRMILENGVAEAEGRDFLDDDDLDDEIRSMGYQVPE